MVGLRRAGQGQHAAELLRRRAPTSSTTPWTAARTSRGGSCPARGSRSAAPEAIMETRPDYVLILPWNIRDEIMGQMADIRDVGRPLRGAAPRGGGARLTGRARWRRPGRRAGDAPADRRALPDLPQHHRRRRARDAGDPRRAQSPLAVHEVPTGTAGPRLDGAAGVEHPRRLGRRTPAASGSIDFRALQPARRELQRAGAGDDDARGAAPAPPLAARRIRTGSPTAPRYYKEDWGFCLAHRVLEALPEGALRGGDRQHARGRRAHLRRVLPPRRRPPTRC